MDWVNHKYIRKEMGRNGKWRYIYTEEATTPEAGAAHVVPLAHAVVVGGAAYRLHASDEKGVTVERVRDGSQAHLDPETFNKMMQAARPLDLSPKAPPPQRTLPGPDTLKPKPWVRTKASASAGLAMTAGQLNQGQVDNNVVHRQGAMLEHGKVPVAVPGSAGTALATDREGNPQVSAPTKPPDVTTTPAPTETPVAPVVDRKAIAANLAAQLRQHGFHKQAEDLLAAAEAEQVAPAAPQDKKTRQSFKSGARTPGMLRKRMEARKKALMAMANPDVQKDPALFRQAHAAAEKATAQVNEIGKGMDGFRPLGPIDHTTIFADRTKGGLGVAHTKEHAERLQRLMGGKAPAAKKAPVEQKPPVQKPVETVQTQRTRKVLQAPGDKVQLTTVTHDSGQTDVGDAQGNHLFTAPTEQVHAALGENTTGAPAEADKTKLEELAVQAGATPPPAPRPPAEQKPAGIPPVPAKYAQHIAAFNALADLQEQHDSVPGLGKELGWTSEHVKDVQEEIAGILGEGETEAISISPEDSWEINHATYKEPASAPAAKPKAPATPRTPKAKTVPEAPAETKPPAAPPPPVAPAPPQSLGRLTDATRLSNRIERDREKRVEAAEAAAAKVPGVPKEQMHRLASQRPDDLKKMQGPLRDDFIRRYKAGLAHAQATGDRINVDLFKRHLDTLGATGHRDVVSSAHDAWQERRRQTDVFPKHEKDWNKEHHQEAAQYMERIARSPGVSEDVRAQALREHERHFQAAHKMQSKWLDTGLPDAKRHAMLNDVQAIKALERQGRNADAFEGPAKAEHEIQRLAELSDDERRSKLTVAEKQARLATYPRAVATLNNDPTRDKSKVKAALAHLQGVKAKLEAELPKAVVSETKPMPAGEQRTDSAWTPTPEGFATRRRADGVFELRAQDGKTILSTHATRGEATKALGAAKEQARRVAQGKPPEATPASVAAAEKKPAFGSPEWEEQDKANRHQEFLARVAQQTVPHEGDASTGKAFREGKLEELAKLPPAKQGWGGDEHPHKVLQALADKYPIVKKVLDSRRLTGISKGGAHTARKAGAALQTHDISVPANNWNTITPEEMLHEIGHLVQEDVPVGRWNAAHWQANDRPTATPYARKQTSESFAEAFVEMVAGDAEGFRKHAPEQAKDVQDLLANPEMRSASDIYAEREAARSRGRGERPEETQTPTQPNKAPVGETAPPRVDDDERIRRLSPEAKGRLADLEQAVESLQQAEDPTDRQEMAQEVAQAVGLSDGQAQGWRDAGYPVEQLREHFLTREASQAQGKATEAPKPAVAPATPEGPATPAPAETVTTPQGEKQAAWTAKYPADWTRRIDARRKAAQDVGQYLLAQEEKIPPHAMRELLRDAGQQMGLSPQEMEQWSRDGFDADAGARRALHAAWSREEAQSAREGYGARPHPDPDMQKELSATHEQYGTDEDVPGSDSASEDIEDMQHPLRSKFTEWQDEVEGSEDTVHSSDLLENMGMMDAPRSGRAGMLQLRQRVAEALDERMADWENDSLREGSDIDFNALVEDAASEFQGEDYNYENDEGEELTGKAKLPGKEWRAKLAEQLRAHFAEAAPAAPPAPTAPTSTPEKKDPVKDVTGEGEVSRGEGQRQTAYQGGSYDRRAPREDHYIHGEDGVLNTGNQKDAMAARTVVRRALDKVIGKGAGKGVEIEKDDHGYWRLPLPPMTEVEFSALNRTIEDLAKEAGWSNGASFWGVTDHTGRWNNNWEGIPPATQKELLARGHVPVTAAPTATTATPAAAAPPARDEEGYDAAGLDAKGYDRKGYDSEGFDYEGYDKEGFDRQGFDREGFDREGINEAGVNEEGIDEQGNKQEFDDQGLDREGYDQDGWDADNMDRNQYTLEKVKGAKGKWRLMEPEEDTVVGTFASRTDAARAAAEHFAQRSSSTSVRAEEQPTPPPPEPTSKTTEAPRRKKGEPATLADVFANDVEANDDFGIPSRPAPVKAAPAPPQVRRAEGHLAERHAGEPVPKKFTAKLDSAAKVQGAFKDRAESVQRKGEDLVAQLKPGWTHVDERGKHSDKVFGRTAKEVEEALQTVRPLQLPEHWAQSDYEAWRDAGKTANAMHTIEQAYEEGKTQEERARIAREAHAPHTLDPGYEHVPTLEDKMMEVPPYQVSNLVSAYRQLNQYKRSTDPWDVIKEASKEPHNSDIRRIPQDVVAEIVRRAREGEAQVVRPGEVRQRKQDQADYEHRRQKEQHTAEVRRQIEAKEGPHYEQYKKEEQEWQEQQQRRRAAADEIIRRQEEVRKREEEIAAQKQQAPVYVPGESIKQAQARVDAQRKEQEFGGVPPPPEMKLTARGWKAYQGLRSIQELYKVPEDQWPTWAQMQVDSLKADAAHTGEPVRSWEQHVATAASEPIKKAVHWTDMLAQIRARVS